MDKSEFGAKIEDHLGTKSLIEPSVMPQPTPIYHPQLKKKKLHHTLPHSPAPAIMVCAARYHNHTLLGPRDWVLAIQEPRDRLARNPENRAPPSIS
jgi:hypothetical protein